MPKRKPPPVLLVDRNVRFEDELLAVVEESGQPPLDLVIESVLGRLPDSSSPEERDAVLVSEIKRYMKEVNDPAFEILCDLRNSCPSTVRKVVGLRPNAEDFAYYKELLDGIEPCLSPLDGAPSVTSLTLRTSWPPEHPVRKFPFSAYIAGSDLSYLVLHFGWYHRPCSPSPAPSFYLVYDTLSNSVTIIPPLPSSGSHSSLGAGLAILGINKNPSYVLAELLRVKSHRTGSHLLSNKGTLFMWWSPRSSSLTNGQWIQREFVLPIPADKGTASSRPTYSFHADMIIPVFGRSILWVDLLKGILVCDRIDNLVYGDMTGEAPFFYFIPLPDGCEIQPDFRTGRGRPDEYRSLCTINNGILKFVSMETHSKGCPMDKVLFRTWFLKMNNMDRSRWRWSMDIESQVDIWNDPVYKNNLRLQPLTPRFPIISFGFGENGKLVDHDIVYLILTDFKIEQGWTVATGSYVFGLDIRHGNITSAIKLPCDKNGSVLPLFASHLNYFSSEEKIPWRSLDLTHEGELRGKQQE